MSDQPLREAKTIGTAMVIETPTGERFLVVSAVIDCPDCGHLELKIPGHHVRGIRDLLIEFCDLHPDLTAADIHTIDRWQQRGVIPENPERN